MAQPAHRALRVIAAYKLLKAVGMLVVAAAAFRLTGADQVQRLAEWMMQLPIHHGHRFVVAAIDRLFELGPRRFIAIGIATSIYAAVFLVEGWGLWREKRWAEYLTAVMTASLIPLEVWELLGQVSWFKLLAFAANVAIVVYLVGLLRRPRSAGADHSS
jgi:uncharacterized membrane protein (DUF2068 family)